MASREPRFSTLEAILGACTGRSDQLGVLVVEPEPNVRALLTQALGEPEFRVRCVEGLAEVGEIAPGESFDAAILGGEEDMLRAIAALSAAVPEAAIVVLADAGEPAEAAAWPGAHEVLERRCLLLHCGSIGPLLRRLLRFGVVHTRIAELAMRAGHDELTGLADRTAFREALGRALARARRHKNCIAVLFVDLDRFKAVNDSWGHAAGDRVLRTVAERLRHGVRSSDLVARWGGDEFMVLLEDVETREAADRVASKLRTALAAPIQVGRRRLRISASIGVVVSPWLPGVDPEALIERADAAMYAAKADGGDRGRGVEAAERE
jgi:diguanylate cyclase (GGDEF)-like protein